MKRLPLLCSVIAFALLCVTVSFWGLRIFKPQNRSVAAPAQQSNIEPGSGQWGSLFGAAPSSQIATSNYQLKGVIIAKRPAESLAIVSANGKPAQSVAIEQQIAAGVVLKEVHEQYVLMSENGVIRRIDLPQNAMVNIAANPVRPPPTEIAGINPVAPVAFPAHTAQTPAPGGPAPVPSPVVTPGLSTASLPAVMPGAPGVAQ